MGLGNRWRGDDAIGPWLLDQLKEVTNKAILKHCGLVEGVNDALGIVSEWEDADCVIAIDACNTGRPPGTILRFDPEARLLPKSLARCSSHGNGLAEAVALSKALGRMPARLTIYAIEAQQFEPGAPLTDAVADAGRSLVNTLIKTITHYQTQAGHHA